MKRFLVAGLTVLLIACTVTLAQTAVNVCAQADTIGSAASRIRASNSTERNALQTISQAVAAIKTTCVVVPPPPPPPPPPVNQPNVPNVVGQTQANASASIVAVNLTVGIITTASSSTVAAGLVISESPAAGTSVSAGSAVDLTVSSGPPPPPPSGGGTLMQSGNLVHLGSFTLPTGIHAGGQANAGFEYGGYGVGYDPSKNGLYMTGHAWDNFIGEVSIPALGGRASLLQMLVDATGGKLAQINPSDPGQKSIGGTLALSDRLIISAFTFYDGSGSAVADHFSRPLTLSGGTVTGPYRVGSLNPGFYAGYMANLPTAWQTALGGTAVTGQCCLSIISRTSFGPALFVFDPTSTSQTAQPLVYYTQSNQIPGGGYSTTSQVFNGSTKVRGVVIPNGTPSVLFFGAQGIGTYCYGETPSPCNDPASTSKGEHAYPYRAQVWAYDANDLAKVKAGTLQPWQVKPYAIWALPDIGGGFDSVGGAAYDPATARIYITQRFGEGELPRVHVYQVK